MVAIFISDRVQNKTASGGFLVGWLPKCCSGKRNILKNSVSMKNNTSTMKQTLIGQEASLFDI